MASAAALPACSEIGGDGGVEPWAGQTGVAGQLGAHRFSDCSTAERLGERCVHPKSAARGERRVAHGTEHVVDEREATRPCPGPHQPGGFGSLQAVEHVGAGAVEGRSDEAHVNLITGGRGDVDDVQIERRACRTLTDDLAQEQWIAARQAHALRGIEVAANRIDHAGRRGDVEPRQRDHLHRRQSGEQAEERGQLRRDVRWRVSGRDQQHQGRVAAETGDVADGVPGPRRRPVQVLDNEQQRAGVGGTRKVAVEHSEHRRPLAFGIDDLSSGDVKAASDVTGQPGEGVRLRAESPLQFVGRQSSQIGFDRRHERLVRALRPFRAGPERHPPP